MLQSSAVDPLLTVRQLADREGLKEREVRRLIAKHGLPCYRIAGDGAKNVKLRRSEFLAWLATKRRVVQPPKSRAL